jgi:hypothetical protein
VAKLTSRHVTSMLEEEPLRISAPAGLSAVQLKTAPNNGDARTFDS